VVKVSDSLAATTFSFEGAEIRTVLIEDEPWLVARDIVQALGLSNITEALRSLADDEFRDHEVVDLRGRVQPGTRLVNEPGLYRLIFRSRRAEAEQFRRWVTHEVLPTIRRTGRYEEAARAALPEFTAADGAALERRLRTLGAARRAGVLSPDEVRTQGLALLAPFGLAPSVATVDEQHDAEALEWIHRSVPAGGEVPLRDLYHGQAHRPGVQRTADVEPVVVRLITAGHLRAIPRPEEKLRGRPPSPRFEVLTASDRPTLTVVRTGGGA
jgi:prophage antirepressor-like protein